MGYKCLRPDWRHRPAARAGGTQARGGRPMIQTHVYLMWPLAYGKGLGRPRSIAR